MTLLLATLAHAASVELHPGDDVASLTASLAAGDEIAFNAGTYEVASYLDWTGKGSEAAPIRLYAKGGEVVIRFTGSWQAAYLHDATWIQIDGLTFEVPTDNAEKPYAFGVDTVSDVTITNCRFGPGGRGVYLSGNNARVVFERNEIFGTADNHGLYIGCSDASCWTQDSSFSENWIHDVGGDNSYLVYLANGGQGNELRDNVLYNTAYRGLAVNSTEYGAQNLVVGNAIWNTGDSGMLIRGPAIVQNNVLFNLGNYGIYSGDNDRGTLENAVITHNTVYRSGSYAAHLESWAGRPGMVFANNALVNTTGYGWQVSDQGVDADNYLSHNVVTGLVDRVDTYTGTDAPYLPGGGDGDFLDPVGWNFYPAAGSLLVGAGDPSADAYVPVADFNGAPRDGASPDAGAYERDGDTNPGWVIAEGFKVLGADGGSTDDVVGGGCCGGEDKGEEAALFLPFVLLGAHRARRRTG